MQEGILARTIAYEEHLKKYPLLETNDSHNLFTRPSKTLKENKKVLELLGNRSIHPEKEHHIIINTFQYGVSSFEYKRHFNDKWEHVTTIKNDRTFVPLTLDEYIRLVKGYTFHLVDKTTESSYSVSVETNSEGLYILKIHDNIGSSVVYAFWIKAKEIRIHINSTDSDFYTPGVEHFD